MESLKLTSQSPHSPTSGLFCPSTWVGGCRGELKLWSQRVAELDIGGVSVEAEAEARYKPVSRENCGGGGGGNGWDSPAPSR